MSREFTSDHSYHQCMTPFLSKLPALPSVCTLLPCCPSLDPLHCPQSHPRRPCSSVMGQSVGPIRFWGSFISKNYSAQLLRKGTVNAGFEANVSDSCPGQGSFLQQED